MTKRPERKKKSTVAKTETVQKEVQDVTQEPEKTQEPAEKAEETSNRDVTVKETIARPLTQKELEANEETATGEFINQNKDKSPLIGVQAVAEYLGRSMTTVHTWRASYPDFPVWSDGPSCVWRTTKEDLDAWKDDHVDLFFSRKQRVNNLDAYREMIKKRRRW